MKFSIEIEDINELDLFWSIFNQGLLVANPPNEIKLSEAKRKLKSKFTTEKNKLKKKLK